MKQHKLFYGSSYDRGLEHLLLIWSDIKEKVPDATLDIAYGWDLFVKGYGNNPERMAWKEKMDKLMEQDGITHHGRVTKNKLTKIRQKCGIWAYPTHFTEINCITALECQKDGLVPVVINLAALKETVWSGIRIEGDIYMPETREEYRDKLIDLMLDEKKWEEMSKEAKNPEQIKSHTWETIASEWLKVCQ